MKEGWEYKKLDEVCYVEYGTRVVQKKDGGTIYPVYGGGGETFRMDRFNRSDSIVIARFAMSKQCTRFVKGKFFLNDSGLTIRSKVDKIAQDFLNWHIIALNDEIYLLGKGMAQKNLDMPSFRNITLKIPPLSEQQHIVEELDLLSSIIEKKKAQLKELDNLAQSLFYEMFGDPITNEKGWEVKKLKEACTCITDGDHMPPPKVDKGIPFITISNIDKQNREIDFRDTFFVPQSYYDSINKERKAQIDDVLYTVTGSYGIPIIVKEDRNFCFQRHIALLRPNKHLVSPCYLCYWALCKSIKYLADDVATGIAQKTVGLSSLREFPIILPSLALQQQFASKIEAIEHQKELIKQSIKEVETLFNSRMDYYFN